MKIIFNNLKLNNFMSFEEAEINLNKVGYFIVNGINNNKEDSASSNGSGKSTLFEALCWVLTGETIRGTKDVSNIYTTTGACVELDFSIDNDNYKVIRKKDPSNLFFFVNGEDKSGKGIRDTEKIIEQYLPDLTSSLIGSVIVLGQGLPQRFTNNSPSGRKEVLETLSKSNFMIADLKDRVSKRKTDLNQRLRTCEDDILINENNLKNAKELIAKTEEKINSLDEIDYLFKRLREEKDKLKEKENKKEAISSVEEESSKQLEKVLNEIEKIETEKESLLQDVVEKHSSFLQELTEKIQDINSSIAFNKKEIGRINNIKDVCPTCGQKIQGIEKPSTKEYEDRLTQYTAERDIFQKDLDALHNTIERESAEILKSYMDRKKQLSDKHNTLIKTSKLNTKELSELNDEIIKINEEINHIKAELNNRETVLQSYEDIIKSNREIVVKCEDNLLYNNREHEELTNRINIINKIFSALNKEFRGYLLTNVIDYINTISKKYCQQVFNNDKLEFKLDGNNISISYCGKEYENLSGGEKQKIDIIIQFAIRNMLTKYLNFSSNILVLDEITDFLDNQGVDSILTLITNNLEETPAIYFITHHSDLMFPYDGEINVVKNNNISSLICK